MCLQGGLDQTMAPSTTKNQITSALDGAVLLPKVVTLLVQKKEE